MYEEEVHFRSRLSLVIDRKQKG